jgi:hypothetical protein
MSVDEALRSLSKEEFDLWFQKRVERRSRNLRIQVNVVMCILAAITLACAVFVVTTFCGDDAWEEGLFLGFLANYCLIGYWRYWEQKNEDETQQEYAEFDDREFFEIRLAEDLDRLN